MGRRAHRLRLFGHALRLSGRPLKGTPVFPLHEQLQITNTSSLAFIPSPPALSVHKSLGEGEYIGYLIDIFRNGEIEIGVRLEIEFTNSCIFS